jgi:hypothetical protein
MPVVIKNLTQRPLYVSLNSGTDLRLSPGEAAADIPDVELKDNAKIEKLLRQRAIIVEQAGGGASEKRDSVVGRRREAAEKHEQPAERKKGGSGD